MNASSRTADGAKALRDWLVESDSALDPQAYVLRPDVVLRLAAQIVSEPTPYLRTRAAVRAGLAEIRAAHQEGNVRIAEREKRWLDILQRQIDSLPDSESALVSEVMQSPVADKFVPREYGLD